MNQNEGSMKSLTRFHTTFRICASLKGISWFFYINNDGIDFTPLIIFESDVFFYG